MSPTTTSLQRRTSSAPRSPEASSGSLKTSTTMTSPSVRRSSMRAEDEPITLKKKACRPVCRRRQWVMIERGNRCLPWHKSRALPRNSETKLWKRTEQDSPGPTKGANPRWLSSGDSKARIPGRLWPKSIQKLNETIELQKEEFIVLKQTNESDKIINFFMNSYWSKTGIFVKLMRRASMKWKNWSDFRVLHSTQLQEENWSKIKILSLN